MSLTVLGQKLPNCIESLPSARLISNILADIPAAMDDRVSMLLPAWSVLVRFDISLQTGANSSDSVPIPVPQGDPYLDPSGAGGVTHAFSRLQRSALPSDARGRGYVQLENTATSFFDVAPIYGATEDEARKIRLFQDGLLNYTTEEHGEFPVSDNGGFVLNSFGTSLTPVVTCLYTLLHREHNRRARDIKAATPDMSDEEIYQSARRWVIAVFQKITYEQYLPAAIGEILPAYTAHDPSVNPNIDVFFSAVSYKAGYSQMDSPVALLDEDYEPAALPSVLLRNSFLNIDPVQKRGIEVYLRGAIGSRKRKSSVNHVDDLRNSRLAGTCCMDLFSIAIQRARDFNIPSYNKARVALGFPRISSWDELSPDVNLQNALAQLYNNDIDKLDALVGALAEDPGNISYGPLMRASLIEQFRFVTIFNLL